MILGVTELRGRSGHEAGRALLAALYRRATGEALPPIAIAPRGKPCFVDSPWYFSISHTKAHAFCALAREAVGLDAEELSRVPYPRLAEKILSPGEYTQYLSAPDKQRALLTFWVLKEAAAKLTGEGLRGYPNHTNFSLTDNRVLEVEGCLVALITQSGQGISPEETYVI